MTKNSFVLYGILCGLTQLNQTFTNKYFKYGVEAGNTFLFIFRRRLAQTKPFMH
jgi:hypothetical protein